MENGCISIIARNTITPKLKVFANGTKNAIISFVLYLIL